MDICIETNLILLSCTFSACLHPCVSQLILIKDSLLIKRSFVGSV